MMKNSILIVALALFCLVGAPAATADPLIEYSLTNIAGNTWQYDYHMSGFDLNAGQVITVNFDYNYCSDITIEGMPDLAGFGWNIFVFQPELNLPDDNTAENGAYNANALVDYPAYSGPFSVQFNWLNAAAAPGAQSFDLFDFENAGTDDNIIFSGWTVLRGGPDVPVVPEPASGLLLLGGLGLLAGAARLRQRK